MKSTLLRLMALSLVLTCAPAIATQNQPDVIGEEIPLTVARVSPGQSDLMSVVRPGDDEGGLAPAREAELVWATELFFEGADYIAPHFSRFDLPQGAYAVVRSLDGTRSWRYEGRGKNVNPGEGFWAIHIYGESAIVEVYSNRPLSEGAVTIDRFARGFNARELSGGKNPKAPLALCGSDDSAWAKCYQTTEANAYNKSKAVARLMINGTGACTGWLVGNQGHVMTNEHCITQASDATNTTFEFMAEGATCSTSCATWGGCPGTVVASTSTFVKNDAALDYALVKLPTNPTGTYGYLQLRTSGAVLNERIYIPQHPAAWGKKIAMKDGSANATVSSLNTTPCSGGSGDLGYNADTQGGSSGSPVLGYSDNLVIGLHHCGTCPNRAVPIQAVISSLGSLLPPGSTAGGGGDTTKPATSVTAPANGATVAGTVTVTATASDNVGVTKIEIYIDGALKTSNTNATSLSYSWSTTSVANGSHTLYSKAYDAAGNSQTSTTITVTVNNTTGGQQLLLNPGFESGNVNWTATSGVITSSTSRPARTGSWKAWLNGLGSTSTETAYQSVTIPASATTATLTFWLRIDTAETTTSTAYDKLQVQIRNSSNAVLATLATYSNLNKNTTYTQKSFSLAAYKGQTIRVYFLGTEDSSLQTSFVIDDTALNVQ